MDGGYIWLNEAASSYPKAPGVAEAMLAALDAFPSCTDRSAVGSDPVRQVLGPVVEECRVRLAILLGGVDAARIILTSGATAGLNQVIWGLGVRLPHGAGIITSVCEHNAVLRPLHHLLRWRPDLWLTHIGLRDGMPDADAFRRALADGAGLVVLMHASNVTGRVYDVAPFFAAAHAAGALTALDASQSLGHVPVLPDVLHADVVAFPGHKGLRGPIGCGGLYVRAGVEIEPLLVGGTGKFSDADYQPEELPFRLEAGTPNIPAFAGLHAALGWHATEGDACAQRGRVLGRQLRDGLRAISGITLIDDDLAVDYLPVISLTCAGRDVEEMGRRLAMQYRIISRAGLHCAPRIHAALGCAPAGTLRLSCSGFNSEDDIAVAVRAVSELASGAC